MFDENLDAEAYQYSAGDDVGGALGDGNVALAEEDAQQGYQEGDDADDRDDTQDCIHGHVQPQAYTHRQAVDAGGDAKHAVVEQQVARGGDFFLLLFLFHAVENHLSADEGQQCEGHPVVDGLDEGARHVADEGAEKREGELEESENGRQQQTAVP